MISSNCTPEGVPDQCPVCRKGIRVEPSVDAGDAVCPFCGSLVWPAQASGRFGPATQIPEVRLDRELSSGGSGRTFVGELTDLCRRVIVKFIPGFSPDNRKLLERVLREVRHFSRLQHPNIVQLHSAEVKDGYLILMCDYVDGAGLDGHLRRVRGPLSIGDAVYVALNSAAGLHHAHSQRIIHRDLKPSNVLVSRRGDVRIADFGLAFVERSDSIHSVIGTPEYMAPEMVTGTHPIDARSDIFSLGLILYRLLTGRLPFVGGSLLKVLREITEGDFRSAREINERVPQELDDVVSRMLARNPDDRYAGCDQVRSALESLQLANDFPTFVTSQSP